MLALPPDGSGGRCPFCGVEITDAPEDLEQAVRSTEDALRSLIRAARVLNGMQSGFSLALNWDPGRLDQAGGAIPAPLTESARGDAELPEAPGRALQGAAAA
jgi:hypothetical protein